MKDVWHAGCVLFATSVVQGMGLTVGYLLIQGIAGWITVHP